MLGKATSFSVRSARPRRFRPPRRPPRRPFCLVRLLVAESPVELSGSDLALPLNGVELDDGGTPGAGRVSPILGLRTRASVALSMEYILASLGGSGNSIEADSSPCNSTFELDCESEVGVPFDVLWRFRFVPPRCPRRRLRTTTSLSLVGTCGTLGGCSGLGAPALISLIDFSFPVNR